MSPNFYVPQIVFVDKMGVVRAQYSGHDAFVSNNEEQNIRNLALKLLAEPGGSKPSGSKPSNVSKRKTS
jgi:hypothetical protein